MAIRLDGIPVDEIVWVTCHTRSPVASIRLQVDLDAGKRTNRQQVTFETYNALITEIKAIHGVSVGDVSVQLENTGQRAFELNLEMMMPPNVYVGDRGLL